MGSKNGYSGSRGISRSNSCSLVVAAALVKVVAVKVYSANQSNTIYSFTLNATLNM